MNNLFLPQTLNTDRNHDMLTGNPGPILGGGVKSVNEIIAFSPVSINKQQYSYKQTIKNLNSTHEYHIVRKINNNISMGITIAVSVNALI